MTAEHGPVGMVGAGNMGGRMTRRLTGAGQDYLGRVGDLASRG